MRSAAIPGNNAGTAVGLRRVPWFRWGIAAIAALWMTMGCTGRYFRPAPPPSDVPIRYTLRNWPYSEYWTGIVFNGSKIGFSRFRLLPSSETAEHFDIESEGYFRFRFLALDKTVTMIARDQVGPDLKLRRFSHDHHIDGSHQHIEGTVENGELRVSISAAGRTSTRRFPVGEGVYPTSAATLLPLYGGLTVGRRNDYRVFSGETQTVETLTQEIVAYEESDLYPGRAFRMRSRLQGQEVTTWLDAKGRPLLEMSLGGVIIAYLEEEREAKRYLAAAAISKDEALLDFSRIRLDSPLPEPESIRRLVVRISGLPETFSMPTDSRQQCRRESNASTVCHLRRSPQRGRKASGSGPAADETYLASSVRIPSLDPRIVAAATAAAGRSVGDEEAMVRLLIEWLQQNIRPEATDAFSALDVLERKSGECQGFALLYTAFCRAVGIPTRVVNGVTYSPAHQGFLYHTWAENRLGGRWVAVDPIFGQYPADTTHIKLIEGEEPAALVPLIDVIGHIDIDIVEVETVGVDSPGRGSTPRRPPQEAPSRR